METRFVEVTNGPNNWGKFAVCRFTAEEWQYRSVIDANRPLLAGRGWTPNHLLIVDIQTGEGAMFAPWGYASYDLNDKHKIWVCPLFEPFLNWLYVRYKAGGTFETLPVHVDLPDAPFDFRGYRREGAVVAARMMHAEGATHECSEWWLPSGVCAVCDEPRKP